LGSSNRNAGIYSPRGDIYTGMHGVFTLFQDGGESGREDSGENGGTQAI